MSLLTAIAIMWLLILVGIIVAKANLDKGFRSLIANSPSVLKSFLYWTIALQIVAAFLPNDINVRILSLTLMEFCCGLFGISWCLVLAWTFIDAKRQTKNGPEISRIKPS